MACHRRGQIHLAPPSSRTDPPLLLTLKDGQPKRPPVVAVLLHGASRRRTLAWGRLPDILVVQTGGAISTAGDGR
uniref:Uncharacterized protein n=1 Tax=Oryza meridionalis TaxID=40149 RepID=A0A0E0CQL9_9ORYZ